MTADVESFTAVGERPGFLGTDLNALKLASALDQKIVTLPSGTAFRFTVLNLIDARLAVRSVLDFSGDFGALLTFLTGGIFERRIVVADGAGEGGRGRDRAEVALGDVHLPFA